MRITCPNCQTQYNVDPAMIPETGRDVQCSTCAHTWFQTRDDAPAADQAAVPGRDDDTEEALAAWDDDTGAEAEVAAEAEPETEDESAAEPEERPQIDAPSEDAASPASGEDNAADRMRAAMDRPKSPEPEDRPDAEAFTASVRDAVAAPPPEAEDGSDRDEDGPATRTGPALDDEVAEILREEAEFEVTRRRGAEPPPAFEPQGDLGLDEGRPSDVLRERLGRMRGEGEGASDVAAAVATATRVMPDGPRRERLPDIEEINSSLRPGETDDTEEPPLSPVVLAETRRAGFRSGFVTLVGLVAIAIAAYVYAPQIIRLVPASETAMISYVTMANTARDRIDGAMARALAGIEGLVGDAGGGA